MKSILGILTFLCTSAVMASVLPCEGYVRDGYKLLRDCDVDGKEEKVCVYEKNNLLYIGMNTYIQLIQLKVVANTSMMRASSVINLKT